jgi:hypothetical protein
VDSDGIGNILFGHKNFFRFKVQVKRISYSIIVVDAALPARKIPNEGRPVQICTRRQQKADALYQTVAELSGWGAVTIFRKHLQSIRWEFYGL